MHIYASKSKTNEMKTIKEYIGMVIIFAFEGY